MRPLQLVLCCDGTSDDMLVPVVEWTFRQHLGPARPINPTAVVADTSLSRRIAEALQSYPDCDLLVIHRDAEQKGEVAHEKRLTEIAEKVAAAADKHGPLPPHVCLVPVRMAESWLLFDESAIRRAASREHSTVDLGVPKRGHDALANAWRVLEDAMDRASERTGRKLRNFQRDRRSRWVADSIGDFSPLRKLDAFNLFEAEVKREANAWLASQTSDEG